MLFVRGAQEDFDGWAALGNTGWSFKDTLPHFRNLESTDIGNSQWRGRTGPMQISALRTMHSLGPVFLEAVREYGAPIIEDYNGSSQEGASAPQVTQYKGWRWSSARAFLDPIRSRKNLIIKTGFTVEKIEFSGTRCVGVSARSTDHTRHVFSLNPSGEVILSAGSLGSPKVLMLSGIGPAPQLRSHHINVVQNSPSVGENLQEHPNSVVCASVNVRTYNMEATPLRMLLNTAYWFVTGRGPASSPYPHGVAFLRSSATEPSPDLQFLFGPFAFSFDENGVVPYREPAVSIVVNTARPEGRGRITLRSADPCASVRIEHSLLSHPEDVRRQLAGCRIARKILSSVAFAPYMRGEFLPGPNVENDDDLLEHVRRTSFLGYHPVGTARMGADPESVVTPELKVRGILGLRVADASIMPRLISANTNAATLMIAEKAATMILLSRRDTPSSGR